METLFSADSHVVETEDCYADIEPGFRDRRPRGVDDPAAGAIMLVPGLDFTVPAGSLSRAGRPYESWKLPQRWAELHPAGHEPKARLAIQDEEGIVGEVIYPSVGMVICLHRDASYRKACFDAYNRWLAEFCAAAPERLLGIGMAAVRTPEEGVREIEQIRSLGLRGVMLCGDPAFEDYDHASYDPVWQASVDLGMPINFHILTGRESYGMAVRGPKIIQQIVTVRGNQNIIMMMILGGVFDRHPKLRVIMVENDAGWIPHFSFRMDHAWERHRWSLEMGSIQRKPSAYMDECVYATFQDDSSVRFVIGALNLERVMWASDFPHGDGTYPNSRRVVDEVTLGMSAEQRRAIVFGNAAALYGLEEPGVGPIVIGLESYAGKYACALLERQGGVLEIRLHTRGGPVVLDETTHRELPLLFADVALDPENRVVVLTGTGAEFWTEVDDSAWDLSTPAGWDRIYWEGRRLLQCLLDVPVPMIAAVNGPAHVHAEIAVLCDIVLAAETAEFQDVAHFSGFQVVPGDGSHLVWPLLLGHNRGKYFLLTGQKLSAREAQALGVVNEVLPAAELLPRARALAAELARRSPVTLRYTRVALNMLLRTVMQDGVSHGLALEGYSILERAAQRR